VSSRKFSVIIANYNRADLLEQAIQSVLDQTYQDFELVVFDDGSHDHSYDVIEYYCAIAPDKVRLFTHDGRTNKGIVTTYLEAISRAQGEYVAFLEHDDRWSPSYLENKAKVFESHPDVGVVFSPYRVVSQGWFGKDMIIRQWLLRLTIKKGKPFDNFQNLLKSNNVATFSCFATRKSLLDDLPDPPVRLLAFDWWTLTQLSTRSLFYYDNSSYTLWRWSRQSTIGSQQFKEHKERGCNYMELMYREVNAKSDKLSTANDQTFHESQGDFAYFIDYYRKPGPIKFMKFFVRAPVWALAASASLVINFLKFRSNS
jgi:glycosyltransferase involved in cell wall biosynthesis